MKCLVALAVVSILLTACGGRTIEPAAAAQAVSPEPGAVVIPLTSPMLTQIKRDMVRTAELPTDEVVAPGKIEANPSRVSKVVLPVTGRVTRVLVKVGDAVRKDQPLLTIQSPDADAAMSAYVSSQAAVAQAQAALGKAESDRDRAADLFEHDAVAKKDVLSADSAWEQAKASVEQAKAARDQGLRRLTVLGLTPGTDQEVVLRSPLAGKVLELSVVPGEFRNDANASLMTIADLSTIWVTSQVPESAIRFVRDGERVEISLVAYPGETFEGRVSRIADTVDPQTRTIKVQAEMDNRAGRFRPEMYGSIHHIESTAKIPVVPSAALVQDGNRTVVFVEQPAGHFVERAVQVGQPAGDLVRVTSGVKAGDSVVVDGAMLLKGLVPRS
ncbi:MAG TPA: efflux RND transporter periplasmic adaptor subunit [Vicinamibacterales bacterium]|nr:efflux RND transporter periplasmic adaptor subunit [Vicinamibacterales bacterium]